MDTEKIVQDAKELATSRFIEKSTIPIIAYRDNSESIRQKNHILTKRERQVSKPGK